MFDDKTKYLKFHERKGVGLPSMAYKKLEH